MRAGWLLLPVLLAVSPAASVQQPAASPSENLTARQIILRLQERNRYREARLESYTVRRVYRLANELTEKRSELEAEMVYRSPDHIEFRILRQSGSRFLAKRVFEQMMKAEQDARTPDNKRRSALTDENYEFTLLGEEVLEKRRAYVIGLKPKREDTYLIAGRIWVDAADFATVRVVGSPIKRPSVWTRKVELVRGYRKVGPFWLPDRLQTVTEVLLFGQTTVGIESGDYHIRLRPAPAPGQQ